MAEFDFEIANGPMFWVLFVGLIIVMIVAGLWLGRIIGSRTNSGVGAFFIHLLVTLSVTGGILPIIVLIGFGQSSLLSQVSDPDFYLNDDDLMNFGIQMLKVAALSGVAMVAYFIAGLIGIARGRR